MKLAKTQTLKIWGSARSSGAFILLLNIILMATSTPLEGVHMILAVGLSLLAGSVLLIPQEKLLLIPMLTAGIMSVAGIIQHSQAEAEICLPLVMLASTLPWIGLHIIRHFCPPTNTVS